jgi:hypothetical protein
MPLRSLTKADIEAVATYIRNRATIMKNDKGKEFIGIDGFNHEVNGLMGQLRFGYFGLSEVSENRARATMSAEDAITKLSPEERKALLAKLAALDAPVQPRVIK